MAVRTIPEPTNEDFHVALTGLRNQAQSCEVDLTQWNTREFTIRAAELIAQQAAEIRWLRNIIHKE